MRRAHDQGQAVPLLLAVVVVGLLAVLAAGRLAAAWADAARARTAADAAALACLEGGVAAASTTAATNGARLERVVTDGATCTAIVVAGRASATATAAWSDAPGAVTTEVHHAG